VTGRTPLILQSEAAECGLACLAMVAGAHGLATDLSTLRARGGASPRGSSLAALMRLADALGLQPRALRAEPAHLPHLALPCVLHWDLDHYVVLTGWRRGRARIHDPAAGARWVTPEELGRRFTGVVLELVPGPGFAPRDERRRRPPLLGLGRVHGLGASLARILALALALEVLVLVGPFGLQWVVDGAVGGGDRGLLATITLGLAGLVVLQVATAATRGLSVLALTSSLGPQWQQRVFAHLLRLPLPWFERRHAGDVWSRFHALREIQRTLSTHFVEALLDGLMLVLALAAMVAYSPRLAGVAVVGVVAYAVLRAVGVGALRRAGERQLNLEARQTGHFLESLRGVAAVKRFNAEAARGAGFANLVVDVANAEVATRRWQIAFGAAQRLLTGLQRVAVVGLGALAVLDGALSLGMLFAFLAFQELFTLRAVAAIDRGVELGLLRLQSARLADIVLEPPEATEAPSGPDDEAATRDGAPPEAADGAFAAASSPPSIEFRDVAFRYAADEPDVLAGVDLRIEAGESVAIAGASGSGKTTLLKLLLGLYRPTRGQILVDGRPLTPDRLGAWRDRVGAVLQDEPLLSGALAEHIACFDPVPDLDRVREVAAQAGVDAELEALPMGYQTPAGDLGQILSGGQRQRVQLARALYRRPTVLLLDEATSALDVAREREVLRTLDAIGATRVTVAHRPETLAAAERVVVLQGGRIVQDVRRAPRRAGDGPVPEPTSDAERPTVH
jgi:ATP-binding cassette subfamily B protein RaxB